MPSKHHFQLYILKLFLEFLGALINSFFQGGFQITLVSAVLSSFAFLH